MSGSMYCTIQMTVVSSEIVLVKNYSHQAIVILLSVQLKYYCDISVKLLANIWEVKWKPSGDI